MPIDFKPKQNNIDFKPAKPIERQQEPGIVETIGQKGVQGLTFGFLDEIQAGLGALGSKIRDGEDFDKAYNRKLKEARDFEKRAEEANPVTAVASEVAGAVVSPISKALSPIKGASFIDRFISSLKMGALYGMGKTEKLKLDQDVANEVGAISSVSGAIPVAGALIKGSLGGIRSAWGSGRRMLNGLTPEEEVGRKALGMLGAGKQTKTQLVKQAPDIAETILDENIIQTKFDAVSKMWKRTGESLSRRGNQIKNFYKNMKDQIVNENEIGDEITNMIDDLNSGTAQVEVSSGVIKGLKNTANKLYASGKAMSPERVWEARKSWDLRRAFKQAKPGSVKPAEVSANKIEHARLVRRAYQNVLDKRVANKFGHEALEAHKELNRRYSNLATINYLTQTGQFTNRSGLIDRLTIGAVLAASRNPIIAGSFLGGREFGKFVGARPMFMGKDEALRPDLASLRDRIRESFTPSGVIPQIADALTPTEKRLDTKLKHRK